MKIKDKMKRIAVILAALAIAAGSAISMVACEKPGEGDESESESSTPAETPDETPEESEGDDDSSVSVPDFDFMKEDLTKYVTLGQYKDLEIELDAKPTVTDENVEDQIKSDLLNSEIYNTVTDRAVTKEDTVYISYKGIMDGEEFEGGTGESEFFTVYNGGGFIDGFADGIVGAMPGVETAVELNFPEDYYEELAGKPVTFMVTVKHIYEAKELTDEVAAELTGNMDMTADGLREYYRGLLEEKVERSYEEYKLDMVWSRIFESAEEKELPEDLIKSYYNIDVQYYSTYAMMYGISYEEILEMVGMTDDDVYARAHDNVMTDMVVYSVIKAENYKITDAEYEELLAELAESSGYSKDEILETYTVEKLTDMFTYTKVYEKAADWQSFTVVEKDGN